MATIMKRMTTRSTSRPTCSRRAGEKGEEDRYCDEIGWSTKRLDGETLEDKVATRVEYYLLFYRFVAIDRALGCGLGGLVHFCIGGPGILDPCVLV